MIFKHVQPDSVAGFSAKNRMHVFYATMIKSRYAVPRDARYMRCRRIPRFLIIAQVCKWRAIHDNVSLDNVPRQILPKYLKRLDHLPTSGTHCTNMDLYTPHAFVISPGLYVSWSCSFPCSFPTEIINHE